MYTGLLFSPQQVSGKCWPEDQILAFTKAEIRDRLDGCCSSSGTQTEKTDTELDDGEQDGTVSYMLHESIARPTRDLLPLVSVSKEGHQATGKRPV